MGSGQDLIYTVLSLFLPFWQEVFPGFKPITLSLRWNNITVAPGPPFPSATFDILK